jgi:hypothetical protein
MSVHDARRGNTRPMEYEHDLVGRVREARRRLAADGPPRVRSGGDKGEDEKLGDALDVHPLAGEYCPRFYPAAEISRTDGIGPADPASWIAGGGLGSAWEAAG